MCYCTRVIPVHYRTDETCATVHVRHGTTDRNTRALSTRGHTRVGQCAWQAANTVRRSNKKNQHSNSNNHCRWHALRSARDFLSLYVGLRPTIAQLRRGGLKKGTRPGKKILVETCEDLGARRVRVGLVYGNVAAVRWVVRPMLDEHLQHLGYNSRSSTGACSALPDGNVTM